APIIELVGIEERIIRNEKVFPLHKNKKLLLLDWVIPGISPVVRIMIIVYFCKPIKNLSYH
ncbi:hypothetical protein PRABACTJOHN_03166, partial [Parabacteroides johnsonii DSM 18315]